MPYYTNPTSGCIQSYAVMYLLFLISHMLHSSFKVRQFHSGFSDALAHYTLATRVFCIYSLSDSVELIAAFRSTVLWLTLNNE